MRANAEFNYMTKNGNSYLEFKADSQMSIDHVEVGMIRNNKIPGLLEMTRLQNDDETTLMYCITSKTSLSQIFSSQMDQQKLCQILGSLCQFMNLASEYMFYTEHVVLNTEYMYMDLTTKEIFMVLLPVMEEVGDSIEFADFIRNLLFHIKYDPADTSGFYISLINYVNSVTDFSPAELQKVIGINGTEKKVESSQEPQLQQPIPQPMQRASQQTSSQGVGAPTQQQEKAKPGLMQNLKGVLGSSPDLKKKETKESKNTTQGNLQNNGNRINIPGMPKANGMNIPEMPKVKDIDAAVSPASIPDSKKIKKEKKELFSFGRKKDKTSKAPQIPVQNVSPMQRVPYMQNTPPAQDILPMQNMAASDDLFDHTMILDGDSEKTVVLGSETQQGKAVVKLVSRKTGQEIIVTKNEFKIGRESKFVDGVISNPTVGRMHASLVGENGKWYVIDNNSVNGTYVNGANQRIGSNQKVALNNNDTLRFGNEEYIFYQ